MWATVFQFVYRWLESAEVEFLLSLCSEWRLTLWLTAGWQSSSRTPKAFGLPVFLAFFMMLMPQSALLSSGCTHMRTHGHIFTMLILISKWDKKKFILTQKIDGLPSPSCCHYQIFNNGLKVYRSSRWQLNQTRVEEFWFCSTKVCKMSCVQKWLDKWKQISIVYHWHLKLNYSLFIRQKL